MVTPESYELFAFDFLALLSACNEIPELAASEMIAIFCIKSKEKK